MASGVGGLSLYGTCWVVPGGWGEAGAPPRGRSPRWSVTEMGWRTRTGAGSPLHFFTQEGGYLLSASCIAHTSRVATRIRGPTCIALEANTLALEARNDMLRSKATAGHKTRHVFQCLVTRSSTSMNLVLTSHAKLIVSKLALRHLGKILLSCALGSCESATRQLHLKGSQARQSCGALLVGRTLSER